MKLSNVKKILNITSTMIIPALFVTIAKKNSGSMKSTRLVQLILMLGIEMLCFAPAL